LADTLELRRQLQDARVRIASLEAELTEARRLESLGRLTSSVAHDFGNVLAAISGYNDLMLRSLAGGSPLRRGAESIQKAVEWGQRLARQLLGTGRVPVDRPSTDLNAVVGGVVKTLGPILGERITVDLRLDPAVGAVGVAAAALEQIAMNLVLNARDAMPSGGRLTVATASSARNGSATESATLSVEDTGVGMDEPTRTRAFEPYFTTKASGKGTGLGLSTVFGIVKQHGGHVDVRSEPGHGSTFQVCLPVVAARAAVVSAPPPATVLVVEDEPGVRDLIVEILEAYHYRALRAADAEEALALCVREVNGIALIVAGASAPGVASGPFAEWLRAVAPEAKILYLTDGTEPRDDESALLAKPFTVEALAEKVREVLGRPSATG
jgi:two-component system, cell cycle sensor histidine kinase and response regulator CckA